MRTALRLGRQHPWLWLVVTLLTVAGVVLVARQALACGPPPPPPGTP